MQRALGSSRPSPLCWRLGRLALVLAIPILLLGITGIAIFPSTALPVTETARVNAASTTWAYGYDSPTQLSRPVAQTSITSRSASAMVTSAVRKHPPLSAAPRFAAEDVGSGARSLFHYTTEEGQKGILDSGQLNPSLKSVNPSDARYGNGQYLTDIAPGTKTGPQLSRALVGNPFQGARFTHYLEIDVSGLNVIEGRAGVFVVPGEEPLDLFGRILGYGANG